MGIGTQVPVSYLPEQMWHYWQTAAESWTRQNNERLVSKCGGNMVSPMSEWTLYLLLWMGGLLTTSPRTRIELEMNGGRGQCWGETKWIQTHGTHRHHTRRDTTPREKQQEVRDEGMWNEKNIRPQGAWPLLWSHFCGSLLAPWS